MSRSRHRRPARFRRGRFLLGASALVLPSPVVAAPAPQFNYRFGDPDPPDYPVPVRIVQMSEAVRRESNGRMHIEIFPNSVLGTANSMLGQLRIGSLQFMTTNHSNYASVVPVSQITSVGYAFASSAQALQAMDGALGAYVRREFAAKGIYVFEKTFESGFRQVTSSLKPIRSVGDFAGFKIRVLPAAIFVDLFKLLGASPVPIDGAEMYVAMQTHVVDGQDSPLATIESFRLYEVQKYISLTNHVWGGYWIAANADAWNALPADIREIVRRNMRKYVLLERRDIHILNVSLADKLRRQGMAFNAADSSGIRAKLSSYYKRWKNEFGPTVWALLEAETGQLA